MVIFSAAYKLAGSFNLRGRLRQLFHVLSDDKIGSGPRLAPNSLQHAQKNPQQQTPSTTVSAQVEATTATEPMVTDQPDSDRDGTTGKANSGRPVKRKSDDSTQQRGKSHKR
jgi:hypothetical protein